MSVFDTKIFKGGSWLFLERTILMAKGFVLSVLFANFLPKEIFGQFQFLIATLGVASIFALPGMGTAIVRGIAREQMGTYSRGVRDIFWWSFLGSLLIVIVALYGYLKGQVDIFGLLLFSALIFPLFSISGTWRYYYTGKENFSQMAKISFILECITLILIVLTVSIGPSVTLLGLVYIFGILFTTIPLVLILKYKTEKGDVDQTNIAYGKRLSVSSGVSGLSNNYDKLLVGQFLGFAELATYNIAFLIPEQIKVVVTSFMIPYLPQFSKTDYRAKLIGLFGKFLLVSFVFAGCYILISPYFFEFFFPKYTEAVFLTQVVAAGLLLAVPFIIIETYFKAQEADQVILISTLVGLIVSILGIFALAPMYGIMGIVVSKIVSYYCQGFFLLFKLMNKVKD